ncbi:MAG: hypothetical protein U0W40_16215 [Acidimicrobiia bacterium]
MELRFDVDGSPAVFTRNDVTGRAELQVGDRKRVLQSPWRLSAHFSLRTRTVWREQIGDHVVEITKVRPRVYGGLQANSFVVDVDGQRVAEATGK